MKYTYILFRDIPLHAAKGALVKYTEQIVVPYKTAT